MSEQEKSLAILVGIVSKTSEIPECDRSLDELERLLDTAGGEVYCRVVQVKDSFDPRTVIGKGKVCEISELVKASDVSLIIFDIELSPMQIRNLEEDIGENVKVIDRSMLILDIFALHATSGEGKLQVELAQLKYSAPRLTGKGIALSRQGGGIGSRGPGESKLETDRRHLHEKVVMLEAKLAELKANRQTMRAQRDRSGLPKISLVGYTNAGKSTLINLLTDAGVLSVDKLFATLDPTTRKLTLPSGESVLLTDTVGFIRKLPHQLVKAFESTLDEVRYADVLFIVCDASDNELSEHIAVTKGVIEELGAAGKPTVYIYNKCDLCDDETVKALKNSGICISASLGIGVSELLSETERIIHDSKTEAELLIPYSHQSLVNSIYNDYSVLEVDYREDGVYIKALLDARGVGLYEKYNLN